MFSNPYILAISVGVLLDRSSFDELYFTNSEQITYIFLYEWKDYITNILVVRQYNVVSNIELMWAIYSISLTSAPQLLQYILWDIVWKKGSMSITSGFDIRSVPHTISMTSNWTKQNRCSGEGWRCVQEQFCCFLERTRIVRTLFSKGRIRIRENRACTPLLKSDIGNQRESCVYCTPC